MNDDRRAGRTGRDRLTYESHDGAYLGGYWLVISECRTETPTASDIECRRIELRVETRFDLSVRNVPRCRDDEDDGNDDVVGSGLVPGPDGARLLARYWRRFFVSRRGQRP